MFNRKERISGNNIHWKEYNMEPSRMFKVL